MFDSELPLHWDTSTTGLEGVEEKELLTASTAGTGRETDPESSTFKYCFQSKGGPYDSNPTLWSPASTWSLKLLLLRTALHQVLPKVSQGQPGGFCCCKLSFLTAIFSQLSPLLLVVASPASLSFSILPFVSPRLRQPNCRV